jgi:GT2 family glycosyltransferase
MPKVSAAVLTHNRRDSLLKALESVYAQDYEGDVELVIVDAASTDGTAEVIRTRFPDAKYIRLPRNLGAPAGRNHVYANCTGDYVIHVEDDGYLEPDVFRLTVEHFETDPSVGIISMRQVFTDAEGDHVVGRGQEEIGEFRGNSCALRGAMLEETGYYPEDFFYCGEESDLAIRALDAGYRIISDPRLVVHHPVAGGSFAKKWDYYRFRNPMLIVIHLFPGWLMIKYLLLRAGSYFLLSARRGTFHMYLAALGYVLWHLPTALLRRRPCRAEAVRKHLRLRGSRHKERVYAMSSAGQSGRNS